MNQSTISNALSQYRHIGASSGVDDASPHQLIQLLMEGALARISAAKGFLARSDIARRGENISMAISIIGGLKGALNLDQGGDLARNLDDLYEYMGIRLYEANKNADMDGLNEVQSLLREIKAGWDGIADEVNRTGGVPVVEKP